MRKFRIAVFFLLAALSCARADCYDFAIRANAKEIDAGIEANFATTVMFGESFTLSVYSESELSGYLFQWFSLEVGLSSGYYYSPEFRNNPPAGGSTKTIFSVECYEGGEIKNTKTVEVTVTHRASYAVSFNTDGGVPAVASQLVLLGARAAKPTEAITKPGYDFEGWDFDFDKTPITQPTEIIAKWKSKPYTITFVTQGGIGSPASQSVFYNEEINPPISAPTRTGYTFNGWFSAASGGERFTATHYTFTEDKTLYAQWTPNVYTITFDPDGGATPDALSKQAIFNSAVGTLPSVTKTGYTFKGWYSGTQEYTESTIYSTANNITLKAIWEIRTFAVSFKTNGSTVPSQTVEYYKTAVNPPDPTRIGYTFKGWEFNGKWFDFANYPITENIEIEAVWEINKYTVSFVNEYDASYSFKRESVEHGSTTAPPNANNNPVHEGYDFDGWDFDFARTQITQDTTIKAKWKSKIYLITFDPQGGRFSRPADASKSITYNEAIGELPIPVKDAYNFKGWFTEEVGEGMEITSSSFYSFKANITLYAHWEFRKGSLPTATMLQTTPSLPFGLTYNGRLADPVEITKKADVYGEFGEITTLYNGKPERPRDAGTYRISAIIKASEYYAAALVEDIGVFTISKRNVALSIKQATVKDKDYDAQTKAEVTSLVFETGLCEANTGLCGSDAVSPSDYEPYANFSQQDAGENIPVRITAYWLQGELYKNYNMLSTPIYNTTASIKRAKGILEIKVPEVYELSNPQEFQDIIEVKTNPFIDVNKDIAWKYKWEKAAEFSDIMPNRVGSWMVWAYIESTDNYTGAEDIGEFLVNRGTATTVKHDIDFDEKAFKEYTKLSNLQEKYYVVDWELPDCKIDLARIKIAVKEPDLVLKVGKIPISFEENRGITYHEFSYQFQKLKPGLDTIKYTFYSLDGVYEEENSILIERPIHFDSVTVQKWNNLFLINNNVEKNGGYSFTSYQWFKNGEALPKDTLQFYSAGPLRTDTLKTEDKYSIQMNYGIEGEKQFRISTCEGNSKPPKINSANPNSALKKQMLGINGKSAKSGAKIYNGKGERSDGAAPGIYIIEE